MRAPSECAVSGSQLHCYRYNQSLIVSLKLLLELAGHAHTFEVSIGLHALELALGTLVMDVHAAL